jgi:HEAT repeat protein
LTYQSAHGTPSERSEAVRLLAQYPAESVRDALLLAMEDDEIEVRLEAATALGQVRAPEAVPQLMEWLDAKTLELRLTAVRALGEIDDPRAQSGLARALSDTAPAVRAAAVLALAKPNSEAAPRLLAALDDTDSNVRRSVANALGELGEPSALSPLANHARDEAAEVRAAVLRALGRLHDARALPILVQALSDSDDGVHLAALAALGDTNSPAAVAPLRASLQLEPRLAKTALAALGRIADPSAEKTLIESLEHPELGPAAAFALRQSARSERNRGVSAREPSPPVAALAKALSNTSTAAHTTLLADTLSDLSQLVSIASAVDPLLTALSQGRGDPKSLTRALALSGAPELLPTLLERMARADDTELEAILDALLSYFGAGLGDGRATEPLLARLATAKGPARIKLLRLVGLTHAARALPALAAALPAANAHEQLAIVEAIGQLGSETGRGVLWPLLDSTDPALRLAAARALATSANPALVRELLAAIRGSDRDRQTLVLALGDSLAKLSRDSELAPELRSEVLSVLAPLSAVNDDALAVRVLDTLRNLHDHRSMETIARLLRAPSARRRSAAVFALADFPHEDTRVLLRFVLQHDGPRVAAAAALALGEVGDQRDAAALMRTAQRTLWPLPAAAAFGLVRLAQRGVTKRHSMQRLLCALAGSRDSYVRANVAAGLAFLAAPACDEASQPLAWLGAGHSAAVRVAAAHWARSLASSEGTVDPPIQRALRQCADDPDPSLASACRPSSMPATDHGRLDVEAYASDAQILLREHLVALRLPDGSVFVGYTDSNGHLTLPAAVRGEVILEDPADAVPEPDE